ncbi:DUF565 domain-containing protein [Cyanobium sp. Morenito 9A2]|uniref:DUF565 domain-containing protein n=1 Tax=Cyanobium sp. Morenito 9A2 TaxID=2823718 RepID=UPI0020CBDCA5|nr:DUF565 domain-containing protein [Cyanobium sp. Morenito 9A2]MCP9848675.1 DUF565 domain-containing protein [Cyanobium sp. Morenito 9A2]
MTRLPLEPTRFSRVQERLARLLFGSLAGRWRERSLAILALLLGYYAGSNLTSYFLQSIGQRPLVVLGMVVLIEAVVRLRSHWLKGDPGLGWVLCDNLRIGVVYAVVLEGFKLGS